MRWRTRAIRPGGSAAHRQGGTGPLKRNIRLQNIELQWPPNPAIATENQHEIGNQRTTQHDNITVESRTDRLSSTELNQKLSIQRAEAVKNFLVQVRRLDGSKISAVGLGEERPLTKPGNCKGNGQTSKPIACLQPVRRVEIEVSCTC